MYSFHYAPLPKLLRLLQLLWQPKLAVWALCAGLLLPLNAASNTELSPPLEAQKSNTSQDSVAIFREWRDRLRQGDFEAWKSYLKPLQGKPLFSYLQYLQLNAELSQFSSQQLADENTFDRSVAFMEVWPELHISDNLNRQLIRRIGKEQDWQRLLRVNIDSPPTDIRCLRLIAQHETQPATRKQTLKEAKKIWLRGSSQPNRCDAIFAKLTERKLLKPRDFQQRARNAIIKGDLGLARWLNKQLTKHEQQALQPWFKLRSEPRELEYLLSQIRTQDRAELARHGMHWLAGKHPDEAAALWNRFIAYAKPSDSQQQALWRRLALKAARDHNPKATQWLSTTQLADDDSFGWGWHMRALLEAQDWKALSALGERSLKVDNSTRRGIQYWSAIALSKLGFQSDADRRLAVLAKDRHWYGMLAADLLHQDYPAPDPLPKTDPVNRSLVLSYIEARRARDLHLAGLDWLARGEWAQLIKTLPKSLRQEAALLAHEIDWPSMAARTQAVYTSTNPVETLFPFAWQPLVEAAAEEHQILSAHIWSQMRSESLYMPDAGSGAGAIGLMQLMPATAKSMGKEMKLRNWRSLPLQQPATNIHLGSKYIAKMLARFDDQIILAAAAYNAGPHRVDRWLEARELTDPTIWTEMIPFTETRGYVQRTLYHFAMYQRRIDDKQVRLSRLLDIELPFAVARGE